MTLEKSLERAEGYYLTQDEERYAAVETCHECGDTMIKGELAYEIDEKVYCDSCITNFSFRL